MGPKKSQSNKVKKSIKESKKIDLSSYGFQGLGVVVPGLTPINMNEYTVVKDPNEERKKALESVFNLPRTSLSTVLPPESDIEKITVKEFVNLTPGLLGKKTNDPFTKEREPGSGPVDIEEIKETKKQLDFGNEERDLELMDIEEEEGLGKGVKRRYRKMKTRKAVRKSKHGKKHLSAHKTKSKRRRTSVRRR